MSTPGASERVRPAFTLTELIVVILIIVVMMAFIGAYSTGRPWYRWRSVSSWARDLNNADPGVRQKATDVLIEALREGSDGAR